MDLSKTALSARIRRRSNTVRKAASTGFLLRERLLETLLREIAEGKLEEGQRFPPRRTLGRVWGVSKETTTYAIAKLKREGLLEKSNRKTLMVAAGALARAKRMISAGRRSGASKCPELVHQAEVPSALPNKAASVPPAGNPYGNPFLHAQLVKSLLVELASGTYLEGRAFLSRRAIEKHWEVSKWTAHRAWGELLRHELLQQISQRRWVVHPGAIDRACLLLSEKPQPSLPPPQTWESRRNRILHGSNRPQGYRLLAIHDEGEVTEEALARIRFLMANPGREQPGRRHLAFFQQEVARNFCEADFFYDDGSPAALSMLLQHLTSSQYHGVAVFRNNLFHSRQPLFEQLRPLGLPVAAVLCHCEGEANVSIDCNDVQGGFTTMQVLLQNGHRNITVLAGDLERPFVHRRLQGALDCLRRMNLEQEVRLEVLPTPDGKSASRCLARVLRRRNPPGALMFLWNKQLRDCDGVFDRFRPEVPRKLSVLGCGALIFRTRLFGVPDTVLWDSETIGKLAARQLLGLIHGDPIEHAIQLEMPYIKNGTVGFITTPRTHCSRTRRQSYL